MEGPVSIELAPDLRRRAQRRAAELGLTLSDYIAGMVALDLESWAPGDDAIATIPVGGENGHDRLTSSSLGKTGETDDDAAIDEPVDGPETGVMNIGEAVAARMRKASEHPG
jgi:hypothetical protein